MSESSGSEDNTLTVVEKQKSKEKAAQGGKV